MIPKLCMSCKHLARSTDRIDYIHVCLKGCSIDAVMYGVKCGMYEEHVDTSRHFV